MIKKSKILKIIIFILYTSTVFILLLKTDKISASLHLAKFIIPTIVMISLIYLCYKYIIYTFKESRLENEIVSIVNHTFRTPLTSSLWYTNELEKNISQSEKLTYLQNLENSINKLIGVVDVLTGIKNVKDTSSYYFEATSIREIVEASIKKYRDNINKKNIHFQVSTFKNIPLLTVDLKKITFVIDTVVENAIIYTKKDGQILIDSIYDNKKITLYISDTGIGLEYFDKLMLFNKFYRNKKAGLINTDGLGLRLYLSKIIMKIHKGKIYAKSNGPDKGTTFFIEIPYIR